MTEAIITFKDFSFKYDSQAEPTLKNINLDINKGEKILIAGPSGSGKSTIGRCINGLIPLAILLVNVLLMAKISQKPAYLIYHLLLQPFCKMQIANLLV